MAKSLVEKYSNEIGPAMNKKFNYDSVMEIPKIDKIVLNMGVGDAVSNAKNLDEAVEELTLISGQKPLITKAKKSIANFRLREGMSIGLPRVRDFRGISSRSFDGRGNYTLGIKEQLIFPEIDYDKVNRVRGLDVVIVTTAKTDEEARELLTEFGMPFAK